MINPISSSYHNNAAETTRPAAQSQPTPQLQKPAQQSDTVQLKSAGDVDHDGDSK
ncbi:MAG TPA: hypothetical protein VND65_13730 [Candidatus Binatia bacterium]|nr:hypothetical protein [Candidatus Binatia bacterium]